MSKIARLLVATDLFERSQRAFERAIELKSQAGATVTLLHAVEPGFNGQRTSACSKSAEL
jgi:nucleotide-binding universal stress UspA family protein